MREWRPLREEGGRGRGVGGLRQNLGGAPSFELGGALRAHTGAHGSRRKIGQGPQRRSGGGGDVRRRGRGRGTGEGPEGLPASLSLLSARVHSFLFWLVGLFSRARELRRSRRGGATGGPWPRAQTAPRSALPLLTPEPPAEPPLSGSPLF